jgi:hypothetical protein
LQPFGPKVLLPSIDKILGVLVPIWMHQLAEEFIFKEGSGCYFSCWAEVAIVSLANWHFEDGKST